MHVDTPLPVKKRMFILGREELPNEESDSDEDEFEIEEQTFQKTTSKPSKSSSGLGPLLYSKSRSGASFRPLSSNSLVDNLSLNQQMANRGDDSPTEPYSLQYMEYFNSL